MYKAFRLALAVATLALPDAAAAQAACKAVTHEDARYTVCEVDLRRQSTRLFWKRPDGQDYSYLSKLPQSDPATGRKLLFAMNAGMYHPDYRPVGLYVEDRRVLSKVSTARGPGNFHMKPNGIFYVAGDKAGVMETGAYLKQKVSADIATQSGPMLVIDGRLHPRFTPQGESRKGRNGVGVRDGNTVFFAISEEDVSFGAFARLFSDVLKCPNALFLDGGSVPTLYIPSGVRSGNFLPLGPMIGVYGK
jgi:uncharacterized protein YigE (DUF2233 family)